MGDYNLQGLNPRDFQHLIQAIARKKIASGVTAFGDGRDGTRDLTYSGKMDFPSSSNPWDGYLILGCKFLQRPTANSKRDGDWAIRQLQSDLRKYASSRYKLPRPEYFLFATNISLSGVARIGSRDKVETLLKKFKAKIGLKAYDVWDYNSIRGFLDGDQDIRSAYGNFITSGDVLAQMAKWLDLQSLDFVDTMHTFLQKELITDMSAKLQSAGDDLDVPIALASVFVDLPFAESAEAATLAKRDEDKNARMVVGHLLQAGSLVLRHLGNDVGFHPEKENRNVPPRECRYVIVGGPGQGKSTVAQYLCELYRAAILRDRPTSRLDPRVIQIIKQLEGQQEDFVGLPLVRRFPIRIELRLFSNALDKEPGISLLEYIRRDISTVANADIQMTILKRWLGEYPWLLVLDGLDEVPPSSNRLDVVKQIEFLRVDLAALNADLLIVATTRPQSYSKEFGEDLFRHLYLVPLSTKSALNYGTRLANARCGEDERRRQELISSLEKACRNKATSRLMQSPLQVTIMATLLEATGEPPQQRYRLFAEYYRTIYKRETRRRLLGGIMSERQTDIDTIHAQTGLLLHLVADRAVVTGQPKLKQELESALSDAQFRELVKARLEKIKVPSNQATNLLNHITDGSLQRLVFLVRPREGWIQFDIASLKEFMAAEATMSGADSEVKKRLECIAPAMYWRNVFLFAVGKCFVHYEHMLDSIVGICTDLNEERAAARILNDHVIGQAAKASLWGSRLALDILADGTARQYPEYEVRLAKLAIALIKTVDIESAARLASVYHEDLGRLYREAVDERFGQVSFWQRIGAWYLILALADRGIKWADEMVETKWPTDGDQQALLLDSQDHTLRRKWWLQHILETIPKNNPSWASEHYDEFMDRSRLPSTAMGHQFSVFESVFRVNSGIAAANRSSCRDVVTEFRIIPLQLDSGYVKNLLELRFENAGWHPALCGARFSANPNANELANQLDWLSANFALEQTFYGPLPWPLSACLASAASREELTDMATAARSGALGDSADWAQAERRWSEIGITENDIEYMTDEHWPFDQNIAEVGFPLFASEFYLREKLEFADPGIMLDHIRAERSRKRATWFALASSIRYLRGRGSVETARSLSWADLKVLISPLWDLPPRYRHWRNWVISDFVEAIFVNKNHDADTVDFLAWLGLRDLQLRVPANPSAAWDELVHHFCADPQRNRGLLRFISLAVESGRNLTVPRDILEKIDDADSEFMLISKELMVGIRDLAPEEISSIANILSHCPRPLRYLRRALRVANTVSPERRAALALAVLETRVPGSKNDFRILEMCRTELIEILTMRPSNLNLTDFLSDPRILGN